MTAMERRGGGVPVGESPLSRRIGINWEYLMVRRPWVLKHTGVPPYLLMPEIRMILDATKHANVHLMLNTLWHTGCRVSELIALQASSVLIEDAMRAEVSLKTLKQRGRPRKGAADRAQARAVPVRDPDYILEWERYFATHKPRASERLFDLSRQAVNKRLATVLEQLESQGVVFGLKVTPHTFRHSFAVNAVLHGVPAPVLQKWLGHKYMSSTEIYMQVLAAETGHLMEWVSY